jgi:PAS domain S-box-containing protein
MNDELKTKAELIVELKSLRKNIAEGNLNNQKQMEEALYDSEVRYRNLVEQSPLSIQTLDVSGKTIQVNKAWEDLWGISWEEFSKIDYNILEDEQLKKLELIPYLERAFSGEAVSVPAAEYDAKDTFGVGAKRWVAAQIYPVKDKSGNIRNVTLIHEDITDQKQDEENLRISDLRLKMIVRASGLVVWDWNIVTNELDWDDAYYQMFGYSQEDTLPTLDSWSDFIHPDDTEHTLDSLHRVVESGEMQWVAEYRFKKKDGSYAYTLDWGTVIHDANGKPVRMIGIMLDNTEKKISELKLQKSENRFRSYFELGLIGMVTTSIEKGWLDFNETLLNMFGYSREEFFKLTWEDLTHPEDREADLTQFNRVIDGEIDGYSMEKRFFHKDGSIVSAHISANAIRKTDGTVDHFVAIILDITDLKLAEEALLENERDYIRIQEEAHFGSWSLDLVKNKLDWSDENYRIFGMPSERPSNTYERFLEIVHPDDMEYVNNNWTAAVNDNTPYNIEHRLLIDGQVKWVREVAKVVHNEEGKAIKGVGITEDITDRKLMEEELLKARKLESVGLLAGGIAHDFNNILTGLFGNIELAKMELPTDHEAFHFMHNANQALDKATKLTQQLLTFAKGGDPILEMIDVEQVIQDSIKFSLSGSNVRTILNIPKNLWQVKADKGQLSQVITNLVINADHAMPEGGTLTLEAENIKDVDENLNYLFSEKVVKLKIIDEGSGISAENQKQIFDPYFTTKMTGSGLGLATAHSIISKHNGHISVASEPGVGTTFTIYLPADLSEHRTTGTSTSDISDKSGTRGGHILLMDDEEMILDLSTEMIKSFGYTVDTSSDGKEAIEKYISAKKCGKPFDVVIMDLTIPGGMGGKETMHKLLAIDPEAIVIVSSGYSTDPVIANYSDYGFKSRLVKPFQMVDLKKELSRLLDQR